MHLFLKNKKSIVVAYLKLFFQIKRLIVIIHYFDTVEQYLDIIMNAGNKTYECEECDSEDGICIPPGMCACNRGWMGNNCTEGTQVTHAMLGSHT